MIQRAAPGYGPRPGSAVARATHRHTSRCDESLVVLDERIEEALGSGFRSGSIQPNRACSLKKVWGEKYSRMKFFFRRGGLSCNPMSRSIVRSNGASAAKTLIQKTVIVWWYF